MPADLTLKSGNALVATSIICVLELFFTITLIYKSKSRHHGKISAPQWCALGSFISTFIWAIIGSIVTIMDPFTQKQQNEDYDDRPIRIVFLFWLISFICTALFKYMFMITRLHTTFKDTEYEMSKLSLRMHLIVSIVFYPIIIIALAALNANTDSKRLQFKK